MVYGQRHRGAPRMGSNPAPDDVLPLDCVLTELCYHQMVQTGQSKLLKGREIDRPSPSALVISVVIGGSYIARRREGHRMGGR